MTTWYSMKWHNKPSMYQVKTPASPLPTLGKPSVRVRTSWFSLRGSLPAAPQARTADQGLFLTSHTRSVLHQRTPDSLLQETVLSNMQTPFRTVTQAGQDPTCQKQATTPELTLPPQGRATGVVGATLWRQDSAHEVGAAPLVLGRGGVLTPHAEAGPRVWCPGVGCRRLIRVELSRRQVGLRGGWVPPDLGGSAPVRQAARVLAWGKAAAPSLSPPPRWQGVELAGAGLTGGGGWDGAWQTDVAANGAGGASWRAEIGGCGRAQRSRGARSGKPLAVMGRGVGCAADVRERAQRQGWPPRSRRRHVGVVRLCPLPAWTAGRVARPWRTSCELWAFVFPRARRRWSASVRTDPSPLGRPFEEQITVQYSSVLQYSSVVLILPVFLGVTPLRSGLAHSILCIQYPHTHPPCALRGWTLSELPSST